MWLLYLFIILFFIFYLTKKNIKTMKTVIPSYTEFVLLCFSKMAVTKFVNRVRND